MFVNNQSIYHSLMRRELGGSFSSEKVKNRYLVKNIQGGNCAKRIFNGHSEAIVSFDVKGYFAVTQTMKEIRLWNLETGKCQWIKNIAGLVGVRIIEEYVVYPGGTLGEHKTNIWDLKTGKEIVCIKDRAIQENQVCMIGQRIFAGLNDGNIGEWTIEGERKRTIRSAPFPLTNLFKGSENFLVNVSRNQFFAYDLQKGNSYGSVGTVPGSHRAAIETFYLVKDRLICGYKDKEDGKIYVCCCVIDLETNKITSSYLIFPDQEHIFRSPKIITAILSYQEFIYLALYSGELIATDIAKNTHKILENADPSASVCYLALEGQTLIGGFYGGAAFISNLDKVKFWDIRSLEPIGEMQPPPGCLDMHFDSGKLLAMAGKSLIQWDYFVSEKGETLVDGSPAEIQHGGRAV